MAYVDRMKTMPARDVAHGVGSREANVLAGLDMQWLSEAVDARGGLGPAVDSHVMRASDLQDVFTGMHALTGAWINADFVPADVWDSIVHFVADGVRAEDLKDCPSGVASGMPMYGAHMRTAFWNAMQREVLSPWQEPGTGYGTSDYSVSDRTYEKVGDVAPTVFTEYTLYERLVTQKNPLRVVGAKVTGGTCSSSGVLPDESAGMTLEAMYAVMQVTIDSVGHPACMLVGSGDYTVKSGAVTAELTKMLALAQRALEHFGGGDEHDYVHLGIYGFLPILRVREGSRLSDLGWSWSPS